MAEFVVVGNVNMESNVRIDSFPVEYEPVRFLFHGINSHVSGVGYNLSKSLHTLGNRVRLAGLCGNDLPATMIRSEFERVGMDHSLLLAEASATAQSVILYDASGKRQIFSDLKNLPDLRYPVEAFERAIQGCDVCLLGNLNYARYLIPSIKKAGVLLACDVQAIGGIDDEYNRDYMEAADLLFFSNDRLGEAAADVIKQAAERFSARIIVAGMGSKGTLMYDREQQRLSEWSAFQPRSVVNTVGAGDALFSSFVHFYWKTKDPYRSIQCAIMFAGWKIGESGGAQGFLDEAAVLRLLDGA